MRFTSSTIRRAISLVELLLVITIVLVVMMMIFPTISNIHGSALEARTSAEIKGLSDACEAFKLRYGRYPPVSVALREKGGYPKWNNQAQPDNDVLLISTVFKGIDPELYTTSGGKEWHDWNGNGVPDDGGVILNDCRAMVFWLGGIPKYDATTNRYQLHGFGKETTRPTRLQAGVGRDQFFEFDLNRLVPTARLDSELSRDSDSFRFPEYLDLFGTAYAYTNAYIAGNDFYPLHHWSYPENTAYWSGKDETPPSRPLFYNPRSFQIVSAGRDREMGLEWGQWPPEGSEPFQSPKAKATRDNLCNFCEGRMVRLLK